MGKHTEAALPSAGIKPVNKHGGLNALFTHELVMGLDLNQWDIHPQSYWFRPLFLSYFHAADLLLADTMSIDPLLNILSLKSRNTNLHPFNNYITPLVPLFHHVHDFPLCECSPKISSGTCGVL